MLVNRKWATNFEEFSSAKVPKFGNFLANLLNFVKKTVIFWLYHSFQSDFLRLTLQFRRVCSMSKPYV